MSSITPQGGVRIEKGKNKETKIIQYAKIGNQSIKITVNHYKDISPEKAREKINTVVGKLEKYLKNTQNGAQELLKGTTFQADFDVGATYHVMQAERRNPLLGIEPKIKSTFFRIFTLNVGHTLKSSAWTSLLSEWKTNFPTLPRITCKYVDSVLQENKNELAGLKPSNFIAAYHNYSNRENNSKLDATWRGVKNELENLDEPGKCVIFSPLKRHHHMVCMAEKQNNGKLKLYLFNTGYGIAKHGSPTLSEEGGSIFPRAIAYEVSMEQVKDFLNQLTSLNARSPVLGAEKSVDRVYSLLGDMNDKPIDLSQEKDKFWGRTQLKNSCSGQAEMALLQAVIPKDKFDLVTQQLKKHAAFKMHSAILQGRAFKTSQKLNTLDFVNDLLNGNLNQDLKAEDREKLLEIKADLEAIVPQARWSKLSLPLKISVNQYAKVVGKYKDLNSNTLDDAIKSASYHYALGNYPEVRKILSEIYQRNDLSSLPEKKKEELISLLKKLNKIEKTIGDKSKDAIDLNMGTLLIISKIDANRLENDKFLKKSISSTYETYLNASVSKDAQTPWSHEAYQKFHNAKNGG